MQKYNYVITSTGYKTTDKLTSKDFTFNRSADHTRVTFTQKSLVNNTKNFFQIDLELDDLPLILSKEKKVYSLDMQTFTPKFVQVTELTEDHWLYSPWIEREVVAPKQFIDMSRYVDNYYDSSFLYLFNNEILEIADELKIPAKAVKELFIREAAEFEEYLNPLRLYIYDKYGVLENTSDPETSFINFKKYVLQNHVFKMARYVDIDFNFISFVIASLTRSATNQTSHNKNNKYVIDYFFNKEDKLLKQSVIAFLNKVNVKYDIDGDKISVKNKPFYMFVCNGLLTDMDFLLRLDDEYYNYLTTNLFANNATVCNVSLTTALQIKHTFLTASRVVSIRQNALNTYDVTEILDDFKKLDSTLITTSSGYYSKIKYVNNSLGISEDYTYFKTENTEALFTNCLVRL